MPGAFLSAASVSFLVGLVFFASLAAAVASSSAFFFGLDGFCCFYYCELCVVDLLLCFVSFFVNFSLCDKRRLLLFIHSSPLTSHRLDDIVVGDFRIFQLDLRSPHMLVAEEWTHGLFRSVFILFDFLLDHFLYLSRRRRTSFGHFRRDCLLLFGLFLAFCGSSCGLGGFHLFLCNSLRLTLGFLHNWRLRFHFSHIFIFKKFR